MNIVKHIQCYDSVSEKKIKYTRSVTYHMLFVRKKSPIKKIKNLKKKKNSDLPTQLWNSLARWTDFLFFFGLTYKYKCVTNIFSNRHVIILYCSFKVTILANTIWNGAVQHHLNVYIFLINVNVFIWNKNNHSAYQRMTVPQKHWLEIYNERVHT